MVVFDVRRMHSSPNTDLSQDFMGQCWVDGSWNAHLASPADFFAGADNITKRERAWDRDRTHSLIFD